MGYTWVIPGLYLDYSWIIKQQDNTMVRRMSEDNELNRINQMRFMRSAFI